MKRMVGSTYCLSNVNEQRPLPMNQLGLFGACGLNIPKEANPRRATCVLGPFVDLSIVHHATDPVPVHTMFTRIFLVVVIHTSTLDVSDLFLY
jgi:hypothetical protein